MDYIRLYYFQLAYSIWQFVRTAKFFRLIWGILSSFWNKGFEYSWFKERTVFVLKEGLLNVHAHPSSVSQKFEYIESNCPHGGTKVSFKISKKRYCFILSNRARMNILSYLVCFDEFPVCSERTNLMLGVWYYKELSPDMMVKHIIKGGKISKEKSFCFIDQSSTEELNPNFLRVMSLWPIAAQARNYNFLSFLGTMLLLFFDFFNYPCNQFWLWVKRSFITFFKYFSCKILPRKFRLPLLGVLSSASPEYMICDKNRLELYWRKFKFLVIYKRENSFVPKGYSELDLPFRTPWEMQTRVRGKYNFEGCEEYNKYKFYSREFNINGESVSMEIDYSIEYYKILNNLEKLNGRTFMSLDINDEVDRRLIRAEAKILKNDHVYQVIKGGIDTVERVYNALCICENEGMQPLFASENSVHYISLDEILYNEGPDFIILKLNEGEVPNSFMVSDYLADLDSGLREKIIVSHDVRYPLIVIEWVSKLVEGYYGEPCLPFVRLILRTHSAKNRPPFFKNKKWKKFCIEVDELMKSFGFKRIGFLTKNLKFRFLYPFNSENLSKFSEIENIAKDLKKKGVVEVTKLKAKNEKKKKSSKNNPLNESRDLSKERDDKIVKPFSYRDIVSLRIDRPSIPKGKVNEVGFISKLRNELNSKWKEKTEVTKPFAESAAFSKKIGNLNSKVQKIVEKNNSYKVVSESELRRTMNGKLAIKTDSPLTEILKGNPDIKSKPLKVKEKFILEVRNKFDAIESECSSFHESYCKNSEESRDFIEEYALGECLEFAMNSENINRLSKEEIRKINESHAEIKNLKQISNKNKLYFGKFIKYFTCISGGEKAFLEGNLGNITKNIKTEKDPERLNDLIFLEKWIKKIIHLVEEKKNLNHVTRKILKQLNSFRKIGDKMKREKEEEEEKKKEEKEEEGEGMKDGEENLKIEIQEEMKKGRKRILRKTMTLVRFGEGFIEKKEHMMILNTVKKFSSNVNNELDLEIKSGINHLKNLINNEMSNLRERSY